MNVSTKCLTHSTTIQAQAQGLAGLIPAAPALGFVG